MPRSRGDGPVTRVEEAVRGRVAPLARGWTRDRLQGRRALVGCPARAGMDPRSDPCASVCSRLPRSRGDGPDSIRNVMTKVSVAPLARGWTRGRQARRPRDLGCPARAGMDPSPRSRRRIRLWLPRSRGDGPSRSESFISASLVAPLARGWTRQFRRVRSPHLGCPARAGMDPGLIQPSRNSSRLPRSRGDGPNVRPFVVREDRVAPLARGWTQRMSTRLEFGDGCPARAGMDPSDASLQGTQSGLPRSRGDGPSAGRGSPATGRVAPLARGWTRARATTWCRRGGCPARAGMDPSAWAALRRLVRVAPLARGWTQVSAVT